METKQAAGKADTFESEIELDQETTVIPVIEEEAFLDKRVVETGKVRISKRVSEHEELIDVPLFREDVVVERVPRDKYVDAAPAVRQEGDVMIFSIVREELVIQKRLVLVEELRVRKQIVETHQPQSVTLRKEEVDVIRIAENENSGD
ncbi:MAG: YsnF/AvaK domain-containing protein [Pyrinomonadaceae bacterium]